MTGVLVRGEDTDKLRKGHVKTEADNGGTQLQGKGTARVASSIQELGESPGTHSPSEFPEETNAASSLEF